ncbi:PHB depolymerase family esterase [Amycolatopsis stemonae]
MRRLPLVLVLALALAGCAPPATSTRTVPVGGIERTYRLYRPAGLTGAVPLVLVLHGGFGSGEQAEAAYGWDAEADAGRFLVAYPDGVGRAWNAGGGCCGQPGRTGVDDVGFLTRLVADVSRAENVDPARVYATGISNGGMMAYRLACATTLFAAIAPDSATQLGDCPRPAPVSVLHLHGTADENIPYDGSPGRGVARIDGPPVPDVVARWREVDRCPAPATSTTGVVTTSAAICPGGRAVELITIAGAGHQWPGARGSRFDGRVPGIDPPSPALDATHVIAQFFAAHPAAA